MNERQKEKNTRERKYEGDFLCVTLHLAEIEFAIPMTKEHLANIYRIIRFEHPIQINFQMCQNINGFFSFFVAFYASYAFKLKSKSKKIYIVKTET